MAEADFSAQKRGLRGSLLAGTAFLSAVAWLFVFVVPALAHKVTIVGWVEGDMVHTQSKFAGGKRAIDSAVIVYDGRGAELLRGRTNEQGEFSFPVPKKTDLKIVLRASMGHVAEWKIPAERFTLVAHASEKKAHVGKIVQEAALGGANEESDSAAVVLSREEVQALIEESLDKKLAPLMEMVTEQARGGVTLHQIMGGLGYIVGLVGAALYVVGRGNQGRGRK